MTDIFGWIAAAIGISASIPQMWRVLRSGTSAGISMRLWQINLATTAAWAVHGFLVGSLQMQYPNIIGATLSLVILVFVLRDRKEGYLWVTVVTVVLGLILVGIDAWLGPVAFGLLVVIPQLVGQIAQLRSLLVTADPAGVSAPFLAIFLLGQGLWFVYGIAFNDWALIICAAAMLAIGSINLVTCLVRQRRAKVALAV
ncbi:hypothetical protein G7085_01785 [Tessaracoccus sp. HDW20]|uniref:PQ-loop domain-containing transporter n=1 Tax=Tessaracoccus coleopterorum TaxID=2714950 RepID=UPI0018D2FDFE|nr:hypothetical protein [Tessaracoccus coleopterorum]